MLANLPAPEAYQSVGWLLLAAAALALALNQIAGLIDRLRGRGTSITPQPLEVRESIAYTPLRDHQLLAAEVNALRAEIRAGFAESEGRRTASIDSLHDKLEASIGTLRTEVKSDISGVHNRINDVLAAVSELRGRVGK